MAREENAIGSVGITITVSTESARLLDQLIKRGIYGRTRAAVAAGLVDRRLQDLTESRSLIKEDATKDATKKKQ
jgi:hypothetical protein